MNDYERAALKQLRRISAAAVLTAMLFALYVGVRFFHWLQT